MILALLNRLLSRGRTAVPSVSKLRLQLTGSMLSHRGSLRATNEDAVLYDLPQESAPAARRGSLLIVADGMGGHAAGEVASAIAVETVHRLFYSTDGRVPEVLDKCFAAANETICRRSKKDAGCRGMGTTCTVIAIRGDKAFLGHIGDSRAYILRDGELRQLSEDHTLVAELVRAGSLTAEQAASSPERNVIVRALGTRPIATPQIWSEGLKLRAGDRLMVCSDGLHDLVDETAIRGILSDNGPAEACRALLDAALCAGGHDNISVGVFLIGDATDQPAASLVERPTRKIETPLR